MVRKLEKQEVHGMLADEVIEPCSPNGRLQSYLCRKNGTLHHSVDFRKLNAVIVGHSYQILCMDECIDLLGDAAIFTTLDSTGAYQGAESFEEDWDET